MATLDELFAKVSLLGLEWSGLHEDRRPPSELPVGGRRWSVRLTERNSGWGYSGFGNADTLEEAIEAAILDSSRKENWKSTERPLPPPSPPRPSLRTKSLDEILNAL